MELQAAHAELDDGALELPRRVVARARVDGGEGDESRRESLLQLRHPVVRAPMVVGLGIDDALHVLNRHHERRGDIPATMNAVANAILMTTATTVIGFGSLIFADLPSLRALGSTVSIGMICCGLSSLVLLPALLRAFDGPR